MTSAASDVANRDAPPEAIYDALLRNSKGKVVGAPDLGGAPIADTHAHLDMLHYPELALARAAAHGVQFIVSVIDPSEDPQYELDSLDGWLAQAGEISGRQLLQTNIHPDKPFAGDQGDRAPTVRIISGCHPHNASKWDGELEVLLRRVLADERCVGLGEIGLDYHYDNSPRDVQREVFRQQIRLAHELDLPIALHLREAHPDGLTILREEGLPKAGALLHCFNLDYATLEPFLELGCYIAFGGPVTFNKADDVRDAASRTPIDRLVSETDCPFMAPHPIRGTVCEPASVVFTVARLADVFGLAASDVAARREFATTLYANALRFFRQSANPM